MRASSTRRGPLGSTPLAHAPEHRVSDVLRRVGQRVPAGPEARRSPRRVRRDTDRPPVGVRPGRSRVRIRDTLMWIQGQGFPSSPALAKGRGVRLKPAYEPILLARKPIDGTLDQNLARYGTGALNIDRCRIPDTTKQCPGRRTKAPTSVFGERAGALAREPAPLPRPNMHQQPMRTRLPDRAARRALPFLLHRQGSPPGARGRLRAATKTHRPDVQDRCEE